MIVLPDKAGKLSINSLYLLVWMKVHADEGLIKFSTRDMERMTGLSRQQVRTALDTLEGMNLVSNQTVTKKQPIYHVIDEAIAIGQQPNSNPIATQKKEEVTQSVTQKQPKEKVETKAVAIGQQPNSNPISNPINGTKEKVAPSFPQEKKQDKKSTPLYIPPKRVSLQRAEKIFLKDRGWRWVEDDTDQTWYEWLQYRQQIKKPYESQMTFVKAYSTIWNQATSLLEKYKISDDGGNWKMFNCIIDHAIASSWRGTWTKEHEDQILDRYNRTYKTNHNGTERKEQSKRRGTEATATCAADFEEDFM